MNYVLIAAIFVGLFLLWRLTKYLEKRWDVKND
jgi:hypothetical protein